MTQKQEPAYEVFEGESKYGPEHGTGFGIRRIKDGEVIRKPRREGERFAVEQQCRELNIRMGA